MPEKLYTRNVEDWLRQFEGRVLSIRDIIKGLNIKPEQEGTLRVELHRMTQKKDRVIKPSGLWDGRYKVLRRIEPVRWQDADENSFYNLALPRSHTDNSEFYALRLLTLSPGDVVVIGGMGNSGKSALALNILAENMDDHPCVLMGNEYTSLDNAPQPKFKRRMMNMKWAEFTNGTGESKFTLLPVKEDFDEYIVEGALNIIDWVNLTDKFWEISRIIEGIKGRLGGGLGVVVLQKGEGKEKPRGSDFADDFADVALKIDAYGRFESRLTVGKVKDSRGPVTGKMWAFGITDNGANLTHIREVRKCYPCWGSGRKHGSECPECYGFGYVDTKDVE